MVSERLSSSLEVIAAAVAPCAPTRLVEPQRTHRNRKTRRVETAGSQSIFSRYALRGPRLKNGSPGQLRNVLANRAAAIERDHRPPTGTR
jgi:hypothetical protein